MDKMNWFMFFLGVVFTFFLFTYGEMKGNWKTYKRQKAYDRLAYGVPKSVINISSFDELLRKVTNPVYIEGEVFRTIGSSRGQRLHCNDDSVYLESDKHQIRISSSWSRNPFNIACRTKTFSRNFIIDAVLDVY